MRYASIDAPLTASIRERPARRPGAGEILVRSVLSGVSAGTELAAYRGTIGNLANKRWDYWNDFPILPGYELVGTVEEMGPEVKNFKLGDRVVCHSPHGTRATVNISDAVPVTDGISDEDATFTMLGATTAHGIRRCGITYGDRVLVLGLGVVGWLAAEHASRAGARRVDVADPAAWKRSFAASHGYPDPLDPFSETFEQEILDLTDGAGMDLVIEASGHPDSIPTALRSVRREGTILIQGTHTEPVTINFSDYPLHREVRFVCVWGKGSVDSQGPVSGIWTRRDNHKLAMDLISGGQLNLRDLVTHRFSFEELPEIYRSLHEGNLDSFQIIITYT